MLTINKLRAHPTVDFAAEELKKYLRMMMPEGGDIAICYNPEAKDGFRLGEFSDFDLPTNEVEDSLLDDVVHIETTEEGGILAGSNPRSILFAVYRYLKCNGCRWLYPGVDGEFIPVTPIEPVSYHKKAAFRFRGHCNEGAESQTCMLETIDFYAKQEINIYMIEFDIPFYYYDIYYNHRYNDKNRPPEPVSPQLVLQWKRQCEVEIAKRGLMFHDMGHGWTAEPFGISSTGGWKPKDISLTEEQRLCLAEIGGVRELFHGVALNTNLCMSSPKVRTMMASSIVAYAKKHTNVDYLHVWLADGKLNHCECAQCQKARPSDFYLMIMNEVDEKLTQEGLDTRIVFIAYVDTLFAPEQVTIANPHRFSLLYAPITRSYTSSITPESVIPEAAPYLRNRWKSPRSAEENLAFLRSWQKTWKGPSFSYEYHFWKHQYRDVGGIAIARRIFEDIRSLPLMSLSGYVEDGSQRSFFPNGFAIYVYAEALLDEAVTWEELVDDYFSHAYGEHWKEIYTVLESISDAFDYAYISGEKGKSKGKNVFFDPKRAEKLEQILSFAQQEADLALQPPTDPSRPQRISHRLLALHAEYCIRFADVVKKKALGEDEKAQLAAEEFYHSFGKYEFEIERYFDHCLAMHTVSYIANKK